MDKSNFFAKFLPIGNHTFRYDTRIYLNETNNPSDNDICIGAIVGKNPGSASYKKDKEGKEDIRNGFHVIDLNNDKLLPTVKNIINLNKKDTNLNQYIQVLNLFYLCDSNLNEAIKKYSHRNDLICKAENKHFPFAWYVWGGLNKKLSEYKKRFEFIKADKCFFFTKENNCYELINGVPDLNKLAKHTQGFPYKTNQEISGLMKGLFD